MSDVIWTNPEDPDDVFTVGMIDEYWDMHRAIVTLLAGIEDNKNTDDLLEQFGEACELLELSPDPCPLCGRYSAHSHDF